MLSLVKNMLCRIGEFNKDQQPMEFWKVLKLYIALYALEHFIFSDGTETDKYWRIENAKRMLGIFGDKV